MTLLERIRPWILPGVLVGVVVVGVVYLNSLRNRAGEAERERDTANLEAAGANAAHDATRKQLKEEAERLAKENAGLQAEIERAKGALPGAKPAGTAHGGTGGISVLPVPPSVPPITPPGTVPGAPGAPPGPAACPPCVLLPSDRLDIRVAGVALQGDSGAVGLAATAQVWRLGSPDALLAEGPLKLDVQMKAPAELPGWGAGVLVVGGKFGWTIGPLVSPPPMRLWGMEASLLMGAGLGSGGEWTGAAGALLRW